MRTTFSTHLQSRGRHAPHLRNVDDQVFPRPGGSHQEPTKFTKKTDAENELKKREGDIAKGVPLRSQIARYTIRRGGEGHHRRIHNESPAIPQ